MRRFVLAAFAAALVGGAPALRAIPAPPTIPNTVAGKEGVKAYLLATIASSRQGVADLKSASADYSFLIAANGNTPASAAAAKPKEVADVILRMRDAYERIDSYGYEYMEGIVAGVPSLIKYDVELDSGVPKKGAQLSDAVAAITLKAGDLVIDKEGSLNNFLIEPTVYGTNPRFTSGSATLPGFDKPVGLPNPALVAALADYAADAYGRLNKDSVAWQPTDRDCFLILTNMTPTLADYFDEWKESQKYGSAAGGRFVAVSRISDMRGIMTSVRLAWLAVAPQIAGKDKPLADTISTGYNRVLSFIDTIDARQKKQPMKLETIDALGSQAKERADKLTVQDSQAAALMGVDVNGK